MTKNNEKLLDEIVFHTIQPALYDDCKYKSEEEFEALKQHLIDAIQETEYIDCEACDCSQEYDDDCIGSRK